MRLASSGLLQAFLGSLVVGAVAVACGSDAQHKHERDDAGGAGQGGQPASASGGGTQLEPMGGAGGQQEIVGGGNGGVETGTGGSPPDVSAGGTAGAPPDVPMLPELPAVDCTTIVFKDANLDSAVRLRLDIGSEDITPAKAATLTDLNASGSNIADLSGIECLTGLVTLNLASGEAINSIADLAPLRYLSNLESLVLDANPLTDLSPLVYLTKLQDLSLRDGNAVPDLTPLASLPSLASLHLDNATLTAPVSLAALKNISSLSAVQCIDDATLVSSLTQLKHLELGFMALANPDALKDLGNLAYLDVLDMGLTSAEPFATLTELIHLDLRENSITDIGPLQNLTGLSQLGLFAVPITSIQPLVDNQGLSNGDSVDLSNTPLACQTEKANVATLAGRGVTVVGNPCP